MALFRKHVALLAAGLALLLPAGCSTTADASLDALHATVIDVRTASEYASGHLQGAVDVDVQAADFATKIATYPKSSEYIVYCRSGARAGNAVTQMKAMGFTDVTNAGGIDAASKATGLPIVKS